MSRRASRRPEIGTFLHYVLERCAREAKERGGFRAVTDEDAARLTDGFVATMCTRSSTIFRRRAAASSTSSAACATTSAASCSTWPRSCAARTSSRWTLSWTFPKPATCRPWSSARGEPDASDRHGRPRGRLAARGQALSARGGLQDRAQEVFAQRRLVRHGPADAAVSLCPRGRRRRALRPRDRAGGGHVPARAQPMLSCRRTPTTRSWRKARARSCAAAASCSTIPR